MVNTKESSVQIETVEIIAQQRDQKNRWTPVIGQETLDLLSHLKFSATDKETLKNEAVAILSQCLPPTFSKGQETGLVIGYVQSGKTTSFTTVAALAKDNGYRLIIVITGITRNLFGQSRTRIEENLRKDIRNDRKWQFFDNPKAQSHEKQKMAAALERDNSIPGTDKTVLVTVMKNGTHLNNLIKLISGLQMEGIPTLIIDDEADQASLNNLVNKDKESPTYRRIVALRQLLPHHMFLQYTATPQALLLINLIDILSPRFAALLTAGPGYTGGKTFFEKDLRLIRPIAPEEIPAKDQHLAGPPDSLLEAMRIFFLGVADGIQNGSQGNRSMMVHPSKETMQHANYELWVRQIQRGWSETLQLPDNDPDRQDLISDFKVAYTNLEGTVDYLPPFEELLKDLPRAVKKTIVTKVNAKEGQTPQLDWKQDYSHILVGGEVLNRGYTVEGLTVTYMPRGKGVGNADTIQQRARWFGYKSGYLEYCRVYLTSEMCSMYKEYVEHEEHVRLLLRKHSATGKSLSEWRRAFFLSPAFRPTRHDVIDFEYIRGNFTNGWYTQKAPHDSGEAVTFNRKLIERFLSCIETKVDWHANRTEEEMHSVSNEIDLAFVYQELLTQFSVTRATDVHRFTGLLLQLGKYLDQSQEGANTCTVYVMSQGHPRRRTVDNDDEIPTLFQGANPDKMGLYYPGDEKIRAERGVTIQIHILTVRRKDKVKGFSIIAEEVPTLAVFLPKDMSANWIVQTEKRASKNFARPNWE